MPPRPSSKAPQGSFYPANDTATYRDLLFFEERLKTNAASLNRRKRRYQLFLVQLLLTIAFLLSEVVLHSDFLSTPYRYALYKVFPDYAQEERQAKVHPYLGSGLLFVAVTTLVLFFASGTYSEKIGYANRYVPHANRALRNFNMYLNVRQPPLRSKFPFKPFSFLFSRSTKHSPPPSPPSSRRTRSPSPGRNSRRSSSVPIPSIPPASNPRGELIFSSRVDRSFRESYDRYRAAFERRRERAAHASTWYGWLHLKTPWMRPATPTPPTPGSATPVGAPGPISRSASGPGPGSRARATPPSSQRSASLPRTHSKAGAHAAASTGQAS